MDSNNKFLVFLVDDDTIYCKSLNNYLTSTLGNSITTEVFETGEDCVKNLHFHPNLIFLDYHLDSSDPDASNGLTILKNIQEESPNTPVIMLSGQDLFGVAAQTILKGAIDYIIKDDDAFQKAGQIVMDKMKEATQRS